MSGKFLSVLLFSVVEVVFPPSHTHTLTAPLHPNTRWSRRVVVVMVVVIESRRGEYCSFLPHWGCSRVRADSH